jgi:TonB family protein
MRPALALICLFAPPLLAQSVLFVGDGSTMLPVRAMRDGLPLVEKNGKLEVGYGSRFALQGVPEYAPVFVEVRNIRVQNFHLESMSGGSSINYTFRFNAEFESAYHLGHVFLTLELVSESTKKALFAWEIRDLVPHQPNEVTVDIPVAQGANWEHFKLHIFTDGREVLHSEMPAAYRERVLDRMVANRIRNVSQAETTPFVGPPPQYPPALAKKKVSGTAVVSMRVARNGSIQDPQIKTASDPAFGASVLEAVRIWRFLPRVRDGRPVEAVVEMPFDFAPQS